MELESLPALDMPCPHCTGTLNEAAADRRRLEWDKEMQDAYAAFVNSHPDQPVDKLWESSDVYRELYSREPDPAGVGCPECDYTSRKITQAGRDLLTFLRRHGGTR